MAMTGTTAARSKVSRRSLILGGGAALVLVAIALDTTVVHVGSEQDLRQQAFDPDRFGAAEFPRIREAIVERAAEAPALVTKLAADKAGAVADHGIQAGAFPVMAVTFTGTLGEGKSGIFAVTVPDLPDGQTIRVQTGPAINGTELRDFPGDIVFGAFTNQIEFQDAGAGLNRAMSAEVLSDLDRETLTGKTVTVTGAFTMINPKSWLVTPVRLEVAE
ncbi:DUF2291 family protein [Ponticoccus sp. (in: a-proteobacteria)]|uniref:DUF2291 family protein n=1 Tax=Ponticoccus sp. (in: a-proteobacteria) TaxID=1925025 RepID=UPI003AB7369A